MGKYTIRKEMRFEMAHQLFNSYSKDCHENLHGHSYVVEWMLSGSKLDNTGMIVDFGQVKDELAALVKRYDHALMMPKAFPKEYLDMLARFTKKFFVVDENPTAENMARWFYQEANAIVGNLTSGRVSVSKVRLHETTTGWAEYGEED